MKRRSEAATATPALTGQAFQNFARAIHSQETLQAYTYSLRAYMAFLGAKDPAGLISTDTQKMEQDLMSWIDAHKARSSSASLMRLQFSAIKLFYDMNRVALAWKLISRTIGSTRKRKDRAYTTEEIGKMLEFADHRAKVLILLMASAGVRSGAIPDMKLGQLTKLEKHGIYRIVVYPGYDEEYVTFCSHECAAAIDTYLKFRRSKGENKGRKLSENAPLIREQFDRQDRFEVTHPKHVKKDALEAILVKVLVDSGVRKVLDDGHDIKSDARSIQSYRGSIRHEVKRAHGFRKFFKQQLRRSGADALLIEYLMGHKGGNAREGITKLMADYDPEDQDELLQEYLKGINNLTINEEHRLRVRVSELEEKEQAMERRIEVAVRKQFEKAFELARKNPTLLNVKPEELAKLQPKQP